MQQVSWLKIIVDLISYISSGFFFTSQPQKKLYLIRRVHYHNQKKTLQSLSDNKQTNTHVRLPISSLLLDQEPWPQDILVYSCNLRQSRRPTYKRLNHFYIIHQSQRIGQSVKLNCSTDKITECLKGKSNENIKILRNSFKFDTATNI